MINNILLFFYYLYMIPHSTFEDIVPGKEFLSKNVFSVGHVLCGKKFTDEFLSCRDNMKFFAHL